MRMNKSMAKRLKNLDLEALLASIPLSEKLNALAEAPITQTEVFILKPLLEPDSDISAFFDKTDYEATLNHIHISDFLEEKKDDLTYMLVQGILYATKVHERLSSIGEGFQVVLGLDPDISDVNVRFYAVRPNEPQWITDDLDDYTLNDIIVMDT